MSVLITGTAGFIGFHLAQLLLEQGQTVVGVDCVNDYYDIGLKEARLDILHSYAGFREYRQDIADGDATMEIFRKERPTYCVNLAAQAGVRHSLRAPWSYTHSNIDGFLSVLEACRHYPVKHLVFASTSSVYGANTSIPFKEQHNAEHPLTLYAATKKANEMMAHTYAHLFGIPSSGLRFFTVYGPWGRPDMALFLFTKAICEGRPIDVFNYGNMKRDFTYVGDIVTAISKLLTTPPSVDPTWDAEHPTPNSSGVAPYQVLNIGNSRSEPLDEYIKAIENSLGIKAERNLLPMQDGDVAATWADTTMLRDQIAYTPNTSIAEGVQKFVDWYVEFYKVEL